MSVQFGRWNFDGSVCDAEYLKKVTTVLAPYGPDGGGRHEAAGTCVLYCAFHTIRESRLEVQPHVTQSGVVITWDGRLDNRAELIRYLRHDLKTDATDVAIVAAAYEKWGTECFPKLIGDWALAVWNPTDQSLTLAKDPIGVRHLYYAIEKNTVTWSTILDPLVLFLGRSVEVDLEYMAGWLVFSPAAHLTPYVGIHAVPPSSYVGVQQDKVTIRRHWDFDPGKQIRYRRDSEYEEHFRSVFAESVRRRLRSDTPVLSELSGGTDSSSIVCMSDRVIAGGLAETPRLDTLSYFSTAEPNWNEQPYFAEVEAQRGRTGCHINVSWQSISSLGLDDGHFAAIPGAYSPPSKFTDLFTACMIVHGNRVLLSGTGGDEVMGGVPTPVPELADLLARARLGALAHQLKAFALNRRRPWFHLFWETAREFLPRSLAGTPKNRRPASWLNPGFVQRYRPALGGYEHRLKVFRALPSFQANLNTLNGLRGQLGSSYLSNPPYEKRYPFLDRDLLDFLYAVPREQVVRPGQRRSLMRRALIDIVPASILQRKRKAFVSRTPLAALKNDWNNVLKMSHNMLGATIGIVDPSRFVSAIQEACLGKEISIPYLMRTVVLEAWLRGLRVLEHSPLEPTGDKFSCIGVQQDIREPNESFAH